MSDIKHDLQLAVIDWKKVKVILNDILVMLSTLSDSLPAGAFKNIVAGIIVLLNVLIASLPGIDSESK